MIVEVKTRRDRFRKLYPGSGAINTSKAKHIRSVARSYEMSSSTVMRRFGVTQSRIDLIEVYYSTFMGIFLVKRSLVHSYAFVDRLLANIDAAETATIKLE